MKMHIINIFLLYFTFLDNSDLLFLIDVSFQFCFIHKQCRNDENQQKT